MHPKKAILVTRLVSKIEIYIINITKKMKIHQEIHILILYKMLRSSCDKAL